MAVTKDEAKQKIAELTAKYGKFSPSEVKAYNEAMTKQGLIMPLFRALGWDFDDTNEVTPEEKASNGRVDYAFKLHGVARFYLEAKALKADLTNPDYIKQAVTYAYNRGVTWAILTDFRELRLFNAQTGKGWLSLNCADYVTSFEKLWLFSKESLIAGMLDKEAAQNAALPTPIPVETRLFKQLRQWRGELFDQLHYYNTKLTFNQIDEIIQRLFNRLIFIRTAEDRGIEDKRLRAMVNQWVSSGRKGELINELRHLFREFDGYYDSDLFAHHLLDEDTTFIMGTILESIIDGLYDIPGGLSSYDFSVMDADVLGAVYEQYLGFVAQSVKDRAKHAQAQMNLGIQTETIDLVEKKERRKEHGIYYTPKFVTDYIVRETVGRFLKERNQNEIRNIKILDPACGSGSFLIRAFDELLKHYASQKISQSEQDIDAADRISVLTNNIFGVDLDKQAVEIARLNLLLRSLAKREMLPSLKDNIRQGNSLISGGEAELKGYFGDAWRDKKPFSWDEEFKDTMANGGFDVVIGNPPYIRIQNLPREEADYYRSSFQSAFGSFDIYVLFIEQAIKLLKTDGRLGFITSGKFLKSDYGRKIQQIIHTEATVESIIDLSVQTVFAEATTYPVIVVLRKGAQADELHYTFVPAEFDSSKATGIDTALSTIASDQAAITKGVWPPQHKHDRLLARLKEHSVELGQLWDGMFQGPVTGKDETFILTHQQIMSLSLETALLVPLLKGSVHIRRYYSEPTELFLIFPYANERQGRFELIPESVMAKKYPAMWHYFSKQRASLENREGGRFKKASWYGYSRPQNLMTVKNPKLLCPAMARRATFFYDADGSWASIGSGGGGGGAYAIILKSDSSVSAFYMLGILNSSIATHYIKRVASAFRGDYFGCDQHTLRKLPIRHIDFSNLTDKAMHDTLVALVEKMLELHKKLAPIRDAYSSERDDLVQEIEHTDKQIDNLVYDLYGLTTVERKIVEGETT